MSDQLQDMQAEDRALLKEIQEIQSQLTQRKHNAKTAENGAKQEHAQWRSKAVHALTCKLQQRRELRQRIRELQGPGPDKPSNWWRVYCAAIAGLCSSDMTEWAIVDTARKIADQTMELEG